MEVLAQQNIAQHNRITADDTIRPGQSSVQQPNGFSPDADERKQRDPQQVHDGNDNADGETEVDVSLRNLDRSNEEKALCVHEVLARREPKSAKQHRPNQNERTGQAAGAEKGV